MPSIGDNKAHWDDSQNWRADGDEWSASWGSTATMWHGSILPRIAANLPAGHLLEIACGHGRVTEHLLAHCYRYVGVDLAPSCVAFCRDRFASRPRAQFVATDGASLPGVADSSIDFAFSWDSLVHAELDAITGYLHELARVLRPGGTAFLHHSNLAEFVDASGAVTVENPHWRATSVSGQRVREHAERHGLHVVTQELVQWGSVAFNDCLTLLRRPLRAGPGAPPRSLRHPGFAEELGYLRVLDEAYRASLRS